jgi:hypothetical protein
MEIKATFAIAYMVVGSVASIIYGIYAFQIHNIEIGQKFSRAFVLNQRWFNFLGAAVGWAAGWPVLCAAVACAHQICSSKVYWDDGIPAVHRHGCDQGCQRTGCKTRREVGTNVTRKEAALRSSRRQVASLLHRSDLTEHERAEIHTVLWALDGIVKRAGEAAHATLPQVTGGQPS